MPVVRPYPISSTGSGLSTALTPAVIQMPNSLALVWPSSAVYVSYYVQRRRAVGRYWLMASGYILSNTWVDQSLPDGITSDYRVFGVAANGVATLIATLTGTQAARTWNTAGLDITVAGTYSGGNFQSLVNTAAAIRVSPNIVGDVFIRNVRVRSRGDGIRLGSGTDHYINNVIGFGDHPGVAASQQGSFCIGQTPKGVTLQGALTEGWSFSLLVNGGASTLVQRMVMRGVRAMNMDARQTTAGGYNQVRGGTLAHTFQADNVYKCPEMDIEYNEAIQEYGVGVTEDAFNVYMSSGTAARPYRMRYNLAYGGFPLDGTADPATALGAASGCAFIHDGPNTTDPTNHGFGRVNYNTAIGWANASFALAAGQNMEWDRNEGYTSGWIPNGTGVGSVTMRACNVGMYMANQYPLTAGSFDNLNAHDNSMMHVERPLSANQPGGGTYNNTYSFTGAGTRGNVATVGNVNAAGADQDLSRETTEYMNWWLRASQAGAPMGVTTL